MAGKNFYIMLASPPWAGPTSRVISGPDIQVNDGLLLSGVQQGYSIVLSVDEKAKDASDFPPCDIHGPSRSLLFSQRFIELLEELGVDNVQYFDAEVVYAPTGQKLPYKVANIVGIVSGLDLDRSDVVMSNRGNVLQIREMRLSEDKLQGHGICRLREDLMLIVVHRRIKEAIEAAALSGFMFITDDEYEPGMI
ncbi:imm11 family protein [Corallococcus macrosporus]|uniref:Immunity MXAN-0049 protein domain-containing protein n=1 Tax=Corallococcus macrosporus DSM 14697 TaxID=1189310 RepID=A0A250K150_9BACT|nr:DUF1629 domain-containing protein [Corallococcus macrosporus]ATB49467.1 hypothetical protein MYMAC_005112 [Corallococcus macrosporus DSM 14697]